MSDTKPSTAQVSGFSVAGVHCGLKKDGLLDFALIISDRPCTAAAVFTTNAVKAAPVVVNMERLRHNRDHIRAVAINTVSANACTGQQGIHNAEATARYVAQKLAYQENEVLVMSTGVIGTQLPMERIKHGVDLAAATLGGDWTATASAMMTTDTRPKVASTTVNVGGGRVYHITGVAKGAGMIAPNMATMLSVITTDVALSSEFAQDALLAAVEMSFNRIVVDGDMSTNDTVLLLANGASGASLESPADFEQFAAALQTVCRELAQKIVQDGEGVTKFITVEVCGAPDDEAARQIANTIATSPLVKTAFFGNDANWGRIMAAAGRAGVALSPEALRLWITPDESYGVTTHSLLLVDGGTRTAYSEEQATAIVSQPQVSVLLDCGSGSGSAVVWTCDLSHDYVSINGDYRS